MSTIQILWVKVFFGKLWQEIISLVYIYSIIGICRSNIKDERCEFMCPHIRWYFRFLCYVQIPRTYVPCINCHTVSSFIVIILMGKRKNGLLGLL